MKLAWSGAGCVIPVLGGVLFVGSMLALDYQQKDDFWVWGVMALAIAVVALPLGLLLNSKGRTAARGGSMHHFMYIPLHFWGGLLLLVGIGLFIAEAVAGDSSMARASDDSPSPCAELGATWSARHRNRVARRRERQLGLERARARGERVDRENPNTMPPSSRSVARRSTRARWPSEGSVYASGAAMVFSDILRFDPTSGRFEQLGFPPISRTRSSRNSLGSKVVGVR